MTKRHVFAISARSGRVALIYYCDKALTTQQAQAGALRVFDFPEETTVLPVGTATWTGNDPQAWPDKRLPLPQRGIPLVEYLARMGELSLRFGFTEVNTAERSKRLEDIFSNLANLEACIVAYVARNLQAEFGEQPSQSQGDRDADERNRKVNQFCNNVLAAAYDLPWCAVGGVISHGDERERLIIDPEAGTGAAAGPNQKIVTTQNVRDACSKILHGDPRPNNVSGDVWETLEATWYGEGPDIGQLTRIDIDQIMQVAFYGEVIHAQN